MNLQNGPLQKGFTLVEIVIVIAIIGILAATTVVALKPQEVFANGRNARRLEDIKAMNTAIGQWMSREGINVSDQFSTLGLTASGVSSLTPGDGTILNEGVEASSVTLIKTTGYLNQIPTDPDGSTEYRIGVDDISAPSHVLICTNQIEFTSTYDEANYPNGLFCLSN